MNHKCETNIWLMTYLRRTRTHREHGCLSRPRMTMRQATQDRPFIVKRTWYFRGGIQERLCIKRMETASGFVDFLRVWAIPPLGMSFASFKTLKNVNTQTRRFGRVRLDAEFQAIPLWTLCTTRPGSYTKPLCLSHFSQIQLAFGTAVLWHDNPLREQVSYWKRNRYRLFYSLWILKVDPGTSGACASWLRFGRSTPSPLICESILRQIPIQLSVLPSLSWFYDVLHFVLVWWTNVIEVILCVPCFSRLSILTISWVESSWSTIVETAKDALRSWRYSTDRISSILRTSPQAPIPNSTHPPKKQLLQFFKIGYFRALANFSIARVLNVLNWPKPRWNPDIKVFRGYCL